MAQVKKVIWLLNIGNYAPEITSLTYPLIYNYARKIDAEVSIITEPRFEGWPPVYEKLQIYELGKGNDWNIYIDSDALIHPDLFDITEVIGKDTVLHNGRDIAGNRWRYDRFFRRDGRHIGSCNWFTFASDWCHELWKPLDDLTLEEALRNITLTHNEVVSGVMDNSHLIDDYTVSRNIAKYGFKFETLHELRGKIGDSGEYLWHIYTEPIDRKVELMKEVLERWQVDPKSFTSIPIALEVKP